MFSSMNDATQSMGIVQYLWSASNVRDALGVAACEVREEVWNWLVQHSPAAYSPKGRASEGMRRYYLELQL